MPPFKLNLDQLVRKHEYGPYPDSCILSTTFPPRGFTPSLRMVYMDTEVDAKPIGLDEIEYPTRAPEGSRGACQVRFFGILRIESLDWLSDQGRCWLEYDLRQRDQEITLEDSASHLTLEQLYGHNKGEGTKLSVIICCRKRMPARFLTTKDRSLMMRSEDKLRDYKILSMTTETYNLSINFQRQWRLWALIEEVIATDKKKTKLHERTIDWLIDEYVTRFLERDRYRKIIFNSDEEGVQPDGTTARRRHIRHVPRNEIKGRIAEQAEWILAQQLAPQGTRKHILNIIKWIEFCEVLPKLRKDAGKARQKYWGMPHGVKRKKYEEHDLVKRLCLFGESEEFWMDRLKSARQKKKGRKSVPTREQSLEVELPAELYRPKAVQFHYDSDFSEASTIFTSSSDLDDDGSSSDLQSLVPQYCFQPPEIPAGRFIWHCPGCSYEIDLLNISEDNTAGLSDAQAIAAFLASKQWTYVDENHVRYCLSHMVSEHYASHMKQNGVHLVKRDDGKWYIERWPPREEKNRRSERRKKLKLKMEDPA